MKGGRETKNYFWIVALFLCHKKLLSIRFGGTKKNSPSVSSVDAHESASHTQKSTKSDEEKLSYSHDKKEQNITTGMKASRETADRSIEKFFFFSYFGYFVANKPQKTRYTCVCVQRFIT